MWNDDTRNQHHRNPISLDADELVWNCGSHPDLEPDYLVKGSRLETGDPAVVAIALISGSARQFADHPSE